MKKPLITAHTGCNNTVNNTIESLFEGVALGADINEIDVRVTKDGVPVLWHDDTIKTITGDKLLFRETLYDDFAALQKANQLQLLKDQTKLTSLEEIFEAVENKNVYLNLDLKDDKCVEPVAALVKKWSMENKIVFSGCKHMRAAYIKKRYPDFQVLLNADEELLERKDIPYIEKVHILCDTAISTACCGLNIEYKYCRPELIKYADLRLLPVTVWTVSSDELFQEFIDMGVFSITTYDVAELAKIIKSKMPAA